MTWGTAQDWLGALLLGGLVLLVHWLTGPPRPRTLPEQADRLGRTRRRVGARRRWWPLALALVSAVAHAADDGPRPNSGGGSGSGPDLWGLPALAALVLVLPALLVLCVGYARLCSGGTWLIRGVEIGRSVVEGETWIAARPEFERTTWHRWLVGAVWSALRER